MPDSASPAKRFRELRERAGLSHEQAASRMGISSPSVWDIESFEEELTSCYSPSAVRRFCEAMDARPRELFGVSTAEPAISASELADRIRAECGKRGITLEQFEDAVGWRLSECIDPPERMAEYFDWMYGWKHTQWLGRLAQAERAKTQPTTNWGTRVARGPGPEEVLDNRAWMAFALFCQHATKWKSGAEPIGLSQ